MWLLFSFSSAFLLGIYDVAKKRSLHDNAVIPVLLLNTIFSSLIFSPFIVASFFSNSPFVGTYFQIPTGGWEIHKYVILKAFIVLSSWIFGYFGIKHLPLTIAGQINATRPVMVLVGALLLFGERLNIYQWIGVILSIFSIFMLSLVGKKEGINFRRNKWIFLIFIAAILGAISGLYDKYIMLKLNPLFVQGWFNIYQMIIMLIITFTLWYPNRSNTTPFVWRWSIPLISIFIVVADMFYFAALEHSESMISIVSMIRRGSVLVSFTIGALWFKEKNVRKKIPILIIILIGMVFLYLGTIQ